MKTTILTMTLLSLLSISVATAQDKTTVTANNSEISDNLDLRAVASIFGESKDLNDFEDRLNNPKFQISNLDLNNDNQVDYLRVIETVQGNAHLIIIQSVLGRDQFQDIATVEVMKDTNNRVQVQVVGDVYMYGSNYIYEPVYAYTPVIYTHFWAPRYTPYYSSWYWGYYPSYYVAWNPFPIFRYRSNINVWINFNNHYNYVNHRNCTVIYNNYYRGNRGNYYESQHPNRSFTSRNSGYANRHELDKTRNIRTVGSRGDVASNNGTRTSTTTNGNSRNTIDGQNTRSQSSRGDFTTRSNENAAYGKTTTVGSSSRGDQATRGTTQSSTSRDIASTRGANTTTESTRSNGTFNSVKSNDTRAVNTTSSVRNNTNRSNEVQSASSSRNNTVQSSGASRSAGTSVGSSSRNNTVQSSSASRSAGSSSSSKGSASGERNSSSRSGR